MRILITGTTGHSMPPPYGGVPKLVLTSARKWRESGNEVALTFTYEPDKPDDIGAKAQYYFEYGSEPGKLDKFFFLIRYFFTNPALYISLFRAHYRAAPHVSFELILYAAYGVFLDGVCARWKPDLILSEAALIKSFMAAEIANHRKIPIAIDFYAEIRDLSMGENKYLSENERKYYWVTFLNKANLLIGLDNCTVEAKAYVPAKKLKVFWDTCDYQFFSQAPAEDRLTLREYFKLPKDMFLVGAVGSFELRKGHDHLIEAVARLVKEGENVGVVVCGGGDPAKWQALAKAMGIEGRLFTFRRLSQEDLRKLHRTVDLYTNLSNTQRSCSLDLSLLEAMASGLPVLVYDTGALAKAVPDGDNGYVVPMNEIPKVEEAIMKAYRLTPEERKKMGEKSAAIAAKVDFSITTAIKLGWFKEVVAAYKK
jgi:glycosyltransferase involved in cell wall biosynthesis